MEIERIESGYLALGTVGGRQLAFATSRGRAFRGPADAVLARTVGAIVGWGE